MSTPPVPPGGPPPEPPSYAPPPPPLGPSSTWPYRHPAPGYMPPSKAMAGWALGLSLLICVPVVPAVLGVVLGIVVLRRCADGRDHGKGLAIAAIIVGACVLALTVVGFALGLLGGLVDGDQTTRDDGRIVEGGDVSTLALRVGDCFDDPGLVDGATEQTSVPAVPCAEPHGFEVYHEATLEHDDRPADVAVIQEADALCAAAFRRFVGRPPARSRLEVYFYYPTEESWNELDDRTVTCFLTDPQASPMRGSLRGADR